MKWALARRVDCVQAGSRMKKRHVVLGLLCTVSVITFVDRLAVAIAEPGIRSSLHLSAAQWGWVLSAYVLANALFEIPSGASGDRRGQRFELTRIAVWWSAFTALTGACQRLWQILASRFLFGIGAAGAYPNAAGVIARWFPRREHAGAQGFVWAASRLGGALAPLLLVPLQHKLGWRAVFVILGVIGLAWAIVWGLWFRNDPADQPGISEEELFEITVPQPSLVSQMDLDPRTLNQAFGAERERPTKAASVERHHIPWRQLLALPHLWLLTLAYFCYAWGSWFYFGWFTTWLVRGAGFTVAQMGLFASFPFLMGMLGNLVGGMLSERLVTQHGRKRTYRLITGTCLAVTSALLLAMSFAGGKVAVVIFATLGLGVMDLMLPSAWAMCMSLGGSFSGAATGIMNTAGNLGGWVGAIVFGYIVQATGSYNAPLRLIAGMVILAAILFSMVDCTAALEESLLL